MPGDICNLTASYEFIHEEEDLLTLKTWVCMRIVIRAGDHIVSDKIALIEEEN
jgi:hypothetical protein